MIRYTLKCPHGHQSDAWFSDSATFDRLKAAGQVSCGVCGTSDGVEKALMAPKVRVSEKDAEAVPALSAPAHPLEAELKQLREKIESEADYVGDSFAQQARDMHLGEVEHRPIWGNAKPEEAKSLVEDGIPVAPLPFAPSKKTN
jgi:hypothetical protein